MIETTGGVSVPVDDPAIPAIERLCVIAECTRLMCRYAYRLDHGLGYTVAELFTADGVWASPAVSATGRAGLAEYFARRDAMTERITRHVVTNIDVTVVAPDRALGRSVAIEYRGRRGDGNSDDNDDADDGDGVSIETAPAIVGDYLDEFHRVDGAWFFHRRDVRVVFKRSGERFLRPIGT